MQMSNEGKSRNTFETMPNRDLRAYGITGSSNFDAFGGKSTLYQLGKQYWLPSEYQAGNQWSSATLNPEAMGALGGKKHSISAGGPPQVSSYGGFIGQNMVKDTGKPVEGYLFDSLPDIEKLKLASTFNPGQGGNNSIWADGNFGDVGVKIGAAIAGGNALQGAFGGTANTGALGAGGAGASAGYGGGGGLSTIAGGGTSTLAAPTAGGALATGGSSGAMPFSGAAGAPGVGSAAGGAGTMGGMAGNSAVPAFGGMQGSAAPGVFASTPSSSNWLSSAAGAVGDWAKNLSGKDYLNLGFGLGDMALRYQQGEDMKDIANKASEKSDALMQPQRFPYQDLMNKYYSGEMDITQQPIVKAQMDLAGRQMQAYMAKNGQSGGGSAPFLYARAMKEAGDAASQQYLNQLSGVAGFGFGPGYSGNIYGQYASAGTGGAIEGLEAMSRAIRSTMPQERSWQNATYNAQQQMMGRGDSNLSGVA